MSFPSSAWAPSLPPPGVFSQRCPVPTQPPPQCVPRSGATFPGDCSTSSPFPTAFHRQHELHCLCVYFAPLHPFQLGDPGQGNELPQACFLMYLIGMLSIPTTAIAGSTARSVWGAPGRAHAASLQGGPCQPAAPLLLWHPRAQALARGRLSTSLKNEQNPQNKPLGRRAGPMTA